MRHIHREGTYLRVCDATWLDCADTTFARRFGGRWNAPGSFGVLYLCADRSVAAANARKAYESDGRLTLFDRRPERRPHVQEFTVAHSRFVDGVTTIGLAALGLPDSYPTGGSWSRCQGIARMAYDLHEKGIACRSAAEATRGRWLGEELAIFDTAIGLATRGPRRPFAQWYPLPGLEKM